MKNIAYILCGALIICIAYYTTYPHPSKQYTIRVTYYNGSEENVSFITDFYNPFLESGCLINDGRYTLVCGVRKYEVIKIKELIPHNR